MKEILLKPQAPYFTHLEVDVLDFPNGTSADPRWRMTITVEYAKFDVDQLKNRGINTLGSAIDYYISWIYDQIRFRLLDNWTAVGGLDETLDIVRDHIKDMFEA